MASGATAAMPETMPGSTVSAPPAGAPTPAPTAAPATAPAASPGAGATASALAIPAVLPARTTLATAYDAWAEGNFCPGFPQTQKGDLVVGSDLVPCGGYLRICVMSGKRCAVVQRRDWGPFKGGRHIDMNLGVVRALGFRSLYHFGVRQVRWEPLGGPARTIASTP